MRPFVRAPLALLAAALTACGGDRGAPATEPQTLNVYLWADYIAPDTVANFERETGIKVHFSTYDSNEILETHLLTGHTNYDIVLPTDTFFERLKQAGVFRRLDPGALPNRVNLDPDIVRRLADHDPGNQYATPYLWTSVGIGYNVGLVRKRLGAVQPDSWAILFDPRSASKLQDCGITIIDSPSDVFAAALLYQGRNPNSRDPGELNEAGALLMRIRPFVRSIDSSSYINELANGGDCLALGWSGDISQARMRARDAGNGIKINYFVPREGSLIIVDMMGIPADAPHPKNAGIWLNYLMKPEVMAGITNAVTYPNGNRASLRYVSDAIKNDPAIYPDPAARARLHSLVAASAEYSRTITRLWTRFRTGQ